MMTKNPHLLRVARVVTLAVALGVGGYLVYCAQRDARRDAPPADEKPPVFMPSSKSAPVRITRDPVPQQNAPARQQEVQPPKKKTLLPSSKSGVLRLPGEAG